MKAETKFWQNFSKIITFLILMVGAARVEAQMIGVGLGVTQTSVVTDLDNVDTNSKAAFQMGALFYSPLNQYITGRIGAFYSQNSFLTKNTLSDEGTSVRLDYLNIPVTGVIKLGQGFGLFLGPVFSVNLSSECGELACEAVKGFDVAGTLGAQFHLANSVGIDIFINKSSGEIVKDYEDAQVFGVSIFLLIE